MRITRLRLQDVQRHADLELRPAPGLTVIRGPNESGKSTVQRALELALFRRCTSAGRDIEGMLRWSADGEACPTVEMDFEVDGRPGTLVKRFAGQRGTVRLELDGEVLDDPAAVDRRLAELTGLPSEKFFRSTASVHHQELDDLARDESALRDRLQQSMTGADRGTSRARRRLEEAIRRYQSEGPKNPGLLKRLREEIARLETAVRAGEAALARLEQDRAGLVRGRQRRAAADQRLAEERAGLELSERAATLLTERDAATTRYERLRRAAELDEQIKQRDAEHPSRTGLGVLRPATERLRALDPRISELRAELVEEESVGYSISELPRPWAPFAVAGIALVFAALFVAGVAIPIGQAAAPIMLGLVAAAVVAILIAFRRRRRGQEITRRTQLHAEQITRRLRGRSEVAEELATAERERSETLRRLGVADTPAAEVLLAAETEHVAAIDRLRAEFRGLFGEEAPAGEIAPLRDQAAAEADQKRHALSGLGALGVDPAASVQRFRASVAAAQAELQAAVAEEAGSAARVEANPVDAEAVARDVEGLAELRDRSLAAERRLRIYQTTLQTLELAEQATMKKVARYLEDTMAADVARVTGGRYDQVRVDEGTLTFSAWSKERGDWVDVRELSQGTLDQFYLAARLGLVRQVTQERRPPLVFDDPFLTFDDGRAAAAVVLLRRIAADHQVLYLTTSDRYDAVADAVIELPTPAPASGTS
jgi:DNA repair exonuclease SbcCD ATPase subunit